MYEVWYSVESIPFMVFHSSVEEAVQAAGKLFLDDKAVFEYLVGPNGEILNDVLQDALHKEQRRRKRKKDKQSGKNWVVEVRASFRDDYWAVNSYAPNANAANDRADELLIQLGEGRVRVRELLEEE